MKTTRHLLIALAAVFPAILNAAPNRNPAPASTTNYTLHEWGTFTTVSASDGALLPGLQREEEALPPFIYSHEGMRSEFSMFKGWQRPLANVTVKMETPVIYFYTEQPFRAHVQVGFRGGSISQWYPERSGGEIPPPLKRNAKGHPLTTENTLDFATAYNGRIAWDVDVTPAGENAFGAVFKGNETLSWLFPRQTDAALVKNAKGETEKYLFYRGVGNFGLPVVFTCTADGHLKIKNNGDSAVPGLFVFNSLDGHQAAFARLGPLAPAADVTVDINALKPRDNWKSAVYEDGAALLTAAGLYRKEADSMMQTWWRSYFDRAGLRVFWIVPESFTEKILPLQATPAPAKTVRVLVGRSEILTPAFEKRLVADFAAKPNPPENPWVNDRYFMAYEKRVEQLAGTTASANSEPDDLSPLLTLGRKSPLRQPARPTAGRAPASPIEALTYGTERVTDLMKAAAEGDAYLVEKLILCGAEVNARTNDVSPAGAHVGGLTALMLAAGLGHADAVRVLASNGARIDEKSANGQTALSRAIFAPEDSGKMAAITALLEAGADPNAARPKNRSLVNAAKSQGLDEVVTLLKWHSLASYRVDDDC
ncbi:MAG: ankyrin repeat domain-containing protein [Verrucomicrobiales bacterium]